MKICDRVCVCACVWGRGRKEGREGVGYDGYHVHKSIERVCDLSEGRVPAPRGAKPIAVLAAID